MSSTTPIPETAPPTSTKHANIRLISTKYPNLLLRNPIYQDSDISAIQNLLADDANTKFDPTARTYPPTLERVATAVGKMIEDVGKDPAGRCNLMVVDLSDGAPEGKVVGMSGYGHIKSSPDNVDDRIGNVGVMLAPLARGRGWAQECMKMSVQYGFEGLDFVEVTVGMQAANVDMVKVMERLGWEGKKGWSEKEGFEECEYFMKRANWLEWKQKWGMA